MAIRPGLPRRQPRFGTRSPQAKKGRPSPVFGEKHRGTRRKKPGGYKGKGKKR